MYRGERGQVWKEGTGWRHSSKTVRRNCSPLPERGRQHTTTPRKHSKHRGPELLWATDRPELADRQGRTIHGSNVCPEAKCRFDSCSTCAHIHQKLTIDTSGHALHNTKTPHSPEAGQSVSRRNRHAQFEHHLSTLSQGLLFFKWPDLTLGVGCSRYIWYYVQELNHACQFLVYPVSKTLKL